jgi:hypothetical protein
VVFRVKVLLAKLETRSRIVVLLGTARTMCSGNLGRFVSQIKFLTRRISRNTSRVRDDAIPFRVASRDESHRCRASAGKFFFDRTACAL